MSDSSEPARSVHSSLERVSIDEVENNWERIGQECFTAEERTALASRKAQTRAGFLAVKRALVALHAGVGEKPRFKEKEFVLTHNARGAPKLVRSPFKGGGTIFLSISHTREQAYGLAALAEDDGD